MRRSPVWVGLTWQEVKDCCSCLFGERPKGSWQQGSNQCCTSVASNRLSSSFNLAVVPRSIGGSCSEYSSSRLQPFPGRRRGEEPGACSKPRSTIHSDVLDLQASLDLDLGNPLLQNGLRSIFILTELKPVVPSRGIGEGCGIAVAKMARRMLNNVDSNHLKGMVPLPECLVWL